MLAVKIGHRNELVQNTRLFCPVTPGISRRNRFNQFIPCRHAHPPHLRSRGCQPLGNISTEATTDPWGAFLVTQCAQLTVYSAKDVSHPDTRPVLTIFAKSFC